MASRAIIRRRKYFLDHVSTPSISSSAFSTFQHGRFGLEPRTEQRFLEHGSGDSKCEKEQHSMNLIKKDLLGLGKGFQQRPAYMFALSHVGIGKNEFGLPLSLGARYLLLSVRTASTATAGQPKMDTDDEQSEEQKQIKKKKEASPEECDQAVEGLSTAKAKAKAKPKQVQESQKVAQSVMQKFWARILGVGPALRAVASMSRSQFFFFPSRMHGYIR